MTHFLRHPEVRGEAAPRRAAADSLPRVSGRSSFEARAPKVRLRASSTRYGALAPQDDGQRLVPWVKLMVRDEHDDAN
jgi:hypothetical protein